MNIDGQGEVVRFTHLDYTLAQVLLENKSNWPKRIRDKIEECRHDLSGPPMEGRQIVWMLLNALKTDSSLVTTMT